MLDEPRVVKALFRFIMRSVDWADDPAGKANNMHVISNLHIGTLRTFSMSGDAQDASDRQGGTGKAGMANFAFLDPDLRYIGLPESHICF